MPVQPQWFSFHYRNTTLLLTLRVKFKIYTRIFIYSHTQIFRCSYEAHLAHLYSQCSCSNHHSKWKIVLRCTFTRAATCTLFTHCAADNKWSRSHWCSHSLPGLRIPTIQTCCKLILFPSAVDSCGTINAWGCCHVSRCSHVAGADRPGDTKAVIQDRLAL